MIRLRAAAASVTIIALAATLALVRPAAPLLAQADAPVPGGAGGQSSPIETFTFSGPIQERRFHGLVSNMRCLDNPELSLAESTTPLAREMRMVVFRMLQDDRVDFEIRNHMVDRYGEDVLYQSAFPGHRLLLQFGPIVLLVVGLIAAFLVSMKKRRAPR